MFNFVEKIQESKISTGDRRDEPETGVCQLVVGAGITCDRGTDRFGLDIYLGFVGKRKRV